MRKSLSSRSFCFALVLTRRRPRGGHNTPPGAAHAEPDEGGIKGSRIRRDDARTTNHEPNSPEFPLVPRGISPEIVYSNKRVKTEPDARAEHDGPPAALIRRSYGSEPPPIRQSNSPDAQILGDDVLHRLWQTDPCAADPRSCFGGVSQYFRHIDSTIMLCILPEEIITSWMAGTVNRKSPEDLMLLYSILAVGTLLSGGSRSDASEYAQVADYAQRSSYAASLQLVQSRTLLALYNIAISRYWDANEFLSSATATGTCLQLNQEIERSADAHLSRYPFGMTRICYAECRRRTWWSLLMLERLSPLFPDRPTMIHAEDIYIALPSHSVAFEKQSSPGMRIFDLCKSGMDSTTDHPSEVTKFLVEIVHVWASCQSAIHRMTRRPQTLDAESLRIRSLTKSVDEWRAKLPPNLSFEGPNLETVGFSGKIGSFLTMHLLYQHALLQLNRYHLSVSDLSVGTRTSHLQACHEKAKSIIDIVCCFNRIFGCRTSIMRMPTPFMSAAAATAVDVLTAAGSFDTIGGVIDDTRIAKTVVDRTAKVWDHARSLQAALHRRLEKLLLIRDQARPSLDDEYQVGTSSGGDWRQFHYSFYRPLEQALPIDMDVVYCSAR